VNEQAQGAGLDQLHAHPMPGWIAVVPIPEPDESEKPPAERFTQFGPFLIDTGQQEVKIVRAIVLEVGQLPGPEGLIPFEKDSTVYFTGEHGTLIGGVLFMLAQNVIAWEDASG